MAGSEGRSLHDSRAGAARAGLVAPRVEAARAPVDSRAVDDPRLPERVRTRAELDALLAATTNYEERMPSRGAPRAFDLGRMEAMLEDLGRPERGPRTVHVAGSKGKGTVCHLVAEGLRAQARARGGGPVGLYLSPHLVHLGERVQVDGAPATDRELAEAGDALLPWVRRVVGTPLHPTFFELFTAMAWHLFRARGVAEVVLETGLGGRLDATNVCAPSVTCITSIEREHAALLGDTIEEIAGEKAGILKAGVPCVTLAASPALEVIESRARRLGAPLLAIGRDAVVLDAQTGPGARLGTRVRDGTGTTRVLEAPLAGVHQAPNLLAAHEVLRLLGADAAVVAAAFADVRLPGVLEPIGGAPLVVVDGAHTPRSAQATRAAVSACWPGRKAVLLAAVLGDKDAAGVLGALASGADAIVLTLAPSPRSVPPARLAQSLPEGHAPIRVVEDPAHALEAARSLAGPDGLVLVSGSVYLAGAVKAVYESSSSRLSRMRR